MTKKVRTLEEKARLITFRTDEEYSLVIAEVCRDVRMTPNEFGRMSTMFMVRNRFHELPGQVARMEHTLIRLMNEVKELKELNEALILKAA